MRHMRGQVAITLLLILVGGLVALGLFGTFTYNRLIGTQENVKQSWAQVENVMQRRNDLIPNLVATVKGYAKHEKDTFADVSAALASFNRATTTNEKIALDNTITGLLSRIMSVALQYPTLKADAQFNRLSDELAGTENRIAVERKRFNEAVQNYNVTIRRFPTNLIARLGNFPPEEAYFKAEPAARVAPKVEF